MRKVQINKEIILKWLLIIGGGVEVLLGILIILVAPFLNLLELTTIPIFVQMIGTFLLCFGILLIYASKDVEKYTIIPLINILLRVMMSVKK